jgi:protoheme IX farnesyltransferase
MSTIVPSSVETVVPQARAHTRSGVIALIVVLFKLRVVTLLLFAAFGGAMLASHGAPSAGDLILLLITGMLSASGASALNQYIERHKDIRMKRTSRRPLVTGALNARLVLIVALGMVILASGIALAAGNAALAFFLALGAFIYVGIYTIWLKPRSVLNVVIGGAAGSAAVLSGSAAVGNWSDPGALLLAALLFTWSPMHFWSLALAYRNDYHRAGVPMLPVVTSQGQAVFWMLFHAAATGAFGLLLALHDAMGWIYAIPVGLATIWLLRESALLIRQYTGPRAMSVFKVSNIYLSLVLLAICVAALV